MRKIMQSQVVCNEICSTPFFPLFGIDRCVPFLEQTGIVYPYRYVPISMKIGTILSESDPCLGHTGQFQKIG